MRLLDRYIGLRIVTGYLLIFAALLIIIGIVNFMVELEDVGDRHYTAFIAMQYVLLTLPVQFIFLAPAAALLGSLLVLIGLARHGEIIALRVAGYSTRRIAVAVLRPALGLAGLVLLLTEMVAPPLYQEAVSMRSQAMAEDQLLEILPGKEIWSRKGNQFVNIGKLRYGRIPADISIYEFGDQGRIELSLIADQARLLDDGNWRLLDVRRGQYQEGRWQVTQLDDYLWPALLTSGQLQGQLLPLVSLSLTEHYLYLDYLRDIDVVQEEVALSFWSKLLQPLLIPLLAMFSLAVIFARPRQSGYGHYMVKGVLLATMFLLGTQMIYNAGLVFEVDALLTALAPLLLWGAGIVGYFLWLRKASG